MTTMFFSHGTKTEIPVTLRFFIFRKELQHRVRFGSYKTYKIRHWLHAEF